MGGNISCMGTEVPPNTSLKFVLDNWAKLIGKDKTLTKAELIRLSTLIWPAYRLNNWQKWPQYGTLDEELILSLISYHRRDHCFLELEYAKLFLAASKLQIPKKEHILFLRRKEKKVKKSMLDLTKGEDMEMDLIAPALRSGPLPPLPLPPPFQPTWVLGAGRGGQAAVDGFWPVREEKGGADWPPQPPPADLGDFPAVTQALAGPHLKREDDWPWQPRRAFASSVASALSPPPLWSLWGGGAEGRGQLASAAYSTALRGGVGGQDFPPEGQGGNFPQGEGGVVFLPLPGVLVTMTTPCAERLAQEIMSWKRAGPAMLPSPCDGAGPSQ
ncbi:uncharacterized protein LOC121672997 [Corvus kubaryi]|uniref:uncharacterized protein LOC121672997 n=1 Tax=Corvus kubaryi TaxID=68294 RepID=UPI001C05DD73|nr:uncharacterized protein LOC121672997 [Corvus kubaryi]